MCAIPQLVSAPLNNNNNVNVSESENVKGAESQLKQTAPQRVNIDKQPIDKSKNNSKESRLQQTVPQTSKGHNNKQSSSNGNESQKAPWR